ncbi:hypothetical protein A0H81_03503 [Grifola frondosa]|uniref:Uncharacterized protein n=1 Tax=Grifola frondosa TaxID=5627 RepID=A0A1C7MI36_GRIFR|nr:hypothetical protein A0H81_03503 [Grifola frondosa]
MVNWNGPATVARDHETQHTLYQVSAGIFLWEWITTLYFDWSLLRPLSSEWRGPTIVYLLCRLTGLGTAICTFIQLNLTFEHNSDVSLIVLEVTHDANSLQAMTRIRLHRGGAVFGSHRPSNHRNLGSSSVCDPCCRLCLSGKPGLYLYGIIRNGGSRWNPTEKACTDLHTTRNSVNLVVSGAGSLWRLLQRQGAIWLTVSVAFYIPAVVIISMDLKNKYVMNITFQVPPSMAMTICATRMHRGLYEYANLDEAPRNRSILLEI